MVASAELGRRWGGAVRRGAICAAVGALGAVGLVASATSVGAAGTSTQACTGGSSGSQTVTLTIRASGHNRTVVVHTPSGYTGKTPVPLVLNLHGSGGSATQQEAFSGMDPTADADGFIVAYPQGAIRSGAGYDWNVPNVPLLGGKPVPRGSANDVAFLSQVITSLEQRDCIDAARVYATGFSGGARMSSQLGCDLSTRVAAIAPVSGLRLPTPCAATRPVPVISFHGTADPVDPYNGNGQAYWTYSVPVAAQRWAAQDKCSATPTTSSAGAQATLTQYTGCAGGATVELYTISGAGHTWPGGPPLPGRFTRVVGPQSQVPAASLIWTFFSQHPLS
jgi:polyhydroxybutyrate depolymerase